MDHHIAISMEGGIYVRTYDELRAVAVDMGHDPEEAVKRARTFAACMTECSTGEAVTQAAYRMQREREKESECAGRASIRTYEELRSFAAENGRDPNEAVQRARLFAACMLEASTAEAVRMVAANILRDASIAGAGA